MKVGFTCAYSPLAIIDAAGFVPYRIFPWGGSPEQAGSILHDNMCSHVKRILDRGLAGDLPELAGLMVMNSCDTMRRLADAWITVRPTDRVVVMDLPVHLDEGAVAYFASELSRLTEILSDWAGRPVNADAILQSMAGYNDLAQRLARLGKEVSKGKLPGGRRAFQEILNRSVTSPIEELLQSCRQLEAEQPSARSNRRIPTYLVGNVLPDPDTFQFIESCGCEVVGDDLCTSSRQIVPLEPSESEDPWMQLARGLLSRPRCARTFSSSYPGELGEQIASDARQCGAKGVIAHVMKFCDPYLARLPAIRQALNHQGLPLLVLEGDCSIRSLGQYRTRIEAFVELLGGESR